MGDAMTLLRASRTIGALRELAPAVASCKRAVAGSRVLVVALSFAIPVMVWSCFSYIPFLWHPLVAVTSPGDVTWLAPGMRVPVDQFEKERSAIAEKHGNLPTGVRANPVYLPAPHEVFMALLTSFSTPPQTKDGEWLHRSLWHSVTVIFWGFLISSMIGVPLGVLCGVYRTLGRLVEPFTEFVRYLPAPAFGALCVAILGIFDGPKIAIIVIGTLFQQILIIANTTRKLDHALVEAALTLGAKGRRLLTRVVVPGILPDLYRDQRILLGWAWTYLIVAELIGKSTGITWFITQQARYQHFENVYAAILIIGVVGLGTDICLARLGKWLFPWDRNVK